MLFSISNKSARTRSFPHAYLNSNEYLRNSIVVWHHNVYIWLPKANKNNIAFQGLLILVVLASLLIFFAQMSSKLNVDALPFIILTGGGKCDSCFVFIRMAKMCIVQFFVLMNFLISRHNEAFLVILLRNSFNFITTSI